MEALLILLGLAIPVAWTAAFFMALAARKRLGTLEARFAALEGRLRAGETPAPRAISGIQPPAAEPNAAPTPQPEAAAAEPSAPEPVHQEPEATPGDGPPSSAPAFAPPPSPAPGAAGFEERLGTRWVVWVGGLALALGAIFLVRYSIEQGLIGPGLRVLFGALFAAALVAGGEWVRRKESLSGLRGLPQASIPAILTAAGTTAAYATIWAAHGLYGFIGPAIAFPLLGLVALATLAAALLHGPALAGLGLVGAYVAPMLVSTTQPNFWALYLYLAVVTGAAFALARIRLWRWLAVTAVASSALWLLPGLAGAAAREAVPHAVYLTVCFALAAVLIVSGLLFGPDADDAHIDGVSSGALSAYLLAAALLAVASDHAPTALLAFAALTVAAVAIAWRAPSATASLPIGALLAALVIAEWSVAIEWRSLVAPAGPTAGSVADEGGAAVGLHLALGAGFALLFGGMGFRAQGRFRHAIVATLWAAAATAAPVAILVALYYRVAQFERSIPFAGLALLLAALFATATDILGKRERRPGIVVAEALFATAAVGSLALALTMALEKGWLTVAFALMAPGIAMVGERRPVPFLRWLSAFAAALVIGRILWEPRIVADVGQTPIFNWLLWGYGVPAVAFFAGAHLLRKRSDDVPARMLDSAAILFTVLTLTLEIRHFVAGGDVYRPGPPLLEMGLHACALLAVALGLERVRGRTGSVVHNVGAIAVALLALAVILGLVFAENPLLKPVDVGGPFVNLLLLCYGGPAVLAIALALTAKDTRPMPYRAVAAGTSVVLALAYLTLQVRRFYRGPVLDVASTPGGEAFSDPEMWTYSAVWLVFGAMLLLLGIAIRSQPARMASAAVIFLTVVKVFLYDLASVGGVWRALSFIGLGLVLVGIGWLYQRLLFPTRSPAAPLASPAAGAAE